MPTFAPSNLKIRRNMKEIKTIDGWITRDSSGWISFHDTDPYSITTQSRDSRTDVIKETRNWFCAGEPGVLTPITLFKDEAGEIPVSVETPIRGSITIMLEE